MSTAAVHRALAAADWRRREGRVTRVTGLMLEAQGPAVRIGDLCEVGRGGRESPLPAEVVGFRERHAVLLPFGPVQGIALGATVTRRPAGDSLAMGPDWLGRVVDGLGQALDGATAPAGTDLRSLHPPPLNPLERGGAPEPFLTGVRALDTLLPLARGQRIGIFAGSGVGKSTLIEMLARQAAADVHVLALIGERGREAEALVAKLRRSPAWGRTVVVVATSDQPALLRRRAAFLATALAEYFCDLGQHVCLTLDSATRIAMAQREIGLSAGELPTARGYTPSVFDLLPRLLERGGARRAGGSVTALYAVLVEGDDLTDPIADHLRAILDGHVVLSREIAQRGRYPAFDVPKSVSRLAPLVLTAAELALAQDAVGMLATYEQSRDLIEVGAYQSGSNPRTDRAIQRQASLESFLAQQPDVSVSRDEAFAQLREALGTAGDSRG